MISKANNTQLSLSLSNAEHNQRLQHKLLQLILNLYLVKSVDVTSAADEADTTADQVSFYLENRLFHFVSPTDLIESISILVSQS